jgi:hypothetical protein
MKLSVAMCLAALSACGGGSATTDPVTDPGLYSDYVLTRVNGNPLPALIDQSASAHTFIHAADIRLSANMTFSDQRSTTLTDALGDHSAVVTRTGTFTVNGSTVTLMYQDAFGNGTAGVPATLNGKVLTKVENPNTFTFSR